MAKSPGKIHAVSLHTQTVLLQFIHCTAGGIINLTLSSNTLLSFLCSVFHPQVVCSFHSLAASREREGERATDHVQLKGKNDT